MKCFVARPLPYRFAATLIWSLACPWLLFPGAVPLLSAGSLALLLIMLGLRRRRLGRFLPATPLDSFIAAYLALVGLAFLVSPVPAASLPKLTVITAGVFGYYLSQEWLEAMPGQPPPTLAALTVLLALAGGAISLLGLVMLEWPSRQIVDLAAVTGRLPRFGGSFLINHNEMAGTLLMLLPFSLALVPAPGRGRWLALATLPPMLFLLLLTQSRGAFLALLASILIATVWGRFPLRRLLPILGLALVALLLLLAVISLGGADFLGPLAALDAGSKSGQVEAVSWLSRLEIWRTAVAMIRDYPVLGAGLYAFEPVSRANYPYDLIAPAFRLTHAHNLFLETATSLGLAGLLATLAIWLVALVGGWQVGRQPDAHLRRAALVYGVSLVGYLCFNFFDALTPGQKPGLFVWLVLGGLMATVHAGGVTMRFPWYWSASPLWLFLLLALSPALPRNGANLRLDWFRLGRTESAPPGLAARLQGDPRRQGLLAYAEGDTAAALAYWRSDPQAVAFLINQGAQSAARLDDAAAIAWYDLALALDPSSARAYGWRASAHISLGLSNLALLDYQAAIQHAAEDELPGTVLAAAYYAWANLTAGNGDPPAAVAAYREAIRLDPDHALYYQGLGDALSALGDEAGAAAAYERVGALQR